MDSTATMSVGRRWSRAHSGHFSRVILRGLKIISWRELTAAIKRKCLWRSTPKNRTILERDGSDMLHSFRGNSVGADSGLERHLPMRARRSKASQIRYATGGPNNKTGIGIPWAQPATRTLHTRGACPSLIGSSIHHRAHRVIVPLCFWQRHDDYILITMGCSGFGLRLSGYV